MDDHFSELLEECLAAEERQYRVEVLREETLKAEWEQNGGTVILPMTSENKAHVPQTPQLKFVW